MMRDLLVWGLYLVAGVALGFGYFRCLAWSARLFAAGGNGWAAAALTLGRFGLLGGALYLASRQGAMALLLVAAGVLLARFQAMRGARAALA